MTGPRGRRPGAALLGMVVLTGACSTGSSTSDRWGPDTPHVGACRVLTAAELQAPSNSTAPVPCSAAHTSVTIAVGGIAAATVTSANLRNGTLADLALQRCTTAWQHTVGGTASAQHTTVLDVATFLPTSTQLSEGARWYRCDLVDGGSDGMALVDLPRQVRGLLDNPEPDGWRACRTSPDFATGHQVPCTSEHALRAVGVAGLPDTSAYPSQQTLKAASERACRPVVRRWLAGHSGAGIAFQWPDALAWHVLHDRTAVCWTITTS